MLTLFVWKEVQKFHAYDNFSIHDELFHWNIVSLVFVAISLTLAISLNLYRDENLHWITGCTCSIYPMIAMYLSVPYVIKMNIKAHQEKTLISYEDIVNKNNKSYSKHAAQNSASASVSTTTTRTTRETSTQSRLDSIREDSLIKTLPKLSGAKTDSYKKGTNNNNTHNNNNGDNNDINPISVNISGNTSSASGGISAFLTDVNVSVSTTKSVSPIGTAITPKLKNPMHLSVDNNGGDNSANINSNRGPARLSVTSFKETIIIGHMKHWSQIVTTNYGFELFINHLESEWSVENLLFITEVRTHIFVWCL